MNIAVATFDPTLAPTALHITQAAKTRLARLDANGKKYFRVYITGGGCSGFQYGFQFDESSQDDDTNVACGDISVVIDALSIQYLKGAELDYKEELMGSRFLVSNPNASTTCSCGASFSV